MKSLLLWLCILTAVVALEQEAGGSSSCDAFLAPSRVKETGWGVFAARDFGANEIVEVAPLDVPFEQLNALTTSTVLYDYTYGSTVSFGFVMIYNHGLPPNVKIKTLKGKPATDKKPAVMAATIFYATRPIKAGEELLSAYHTTEDEANEWFRERGFVEMNHARDLQDISIPIEDLQEYKQDYCSKMAAGMGAGTFTRILHGNSLQHKLDASMVNLPLEDAPYAVAKTTIKTEQRIEIAPALVVPCSLIGRLAPLVIQWEHLTKRHQHDIRKLRAAGQFNVTRQRNNFETRSYDRVDGFNGFEKTVLLPVGGFVGMIQRVGSNNPNCRLDISSSGAVDGNAGLVLDIIAMQDIQIGETLRLNIPPPSATKKERTALQEALEKNQHWTPHYLKERVDHDDSFFIRVGSQPKDKDPSSTKYMSTSEGGSCKGKDK